MKLILTLLAAVLCLCSSQAFAADGRKGIGINAGLGIPFLGQGGVDFYFANDLGVSVGYGQLSVDAGSASVSLAMPEVLLKWHPFSGAFFVGAGVGQESLTAKASDASTNQSAEIKVTAMTGIAKLGWMWGSDNGGVWFGIDAAYISPTGATTDISSTLPTTNQAYKDAQDQAKKFGETAYTNITFARLGWLF